MFENPRLEKLIIVEEYFKNSIENILGLSLEKQNSTGFYDGGIHTELLFPTKNSALSKTEYFLPRTHKVLHFTSLDTLNSIIDSKSLWLFNMHKSDDENEYKYAADKFYPIFKIQGFSQQCYDFFVNRTKENCYILSTTDTNQIDNFNLWTNYGDNYKGVAIELEILNDPLEWENSYFSKIKYGELESLDSLISTWEKLQTSNTKNKYSIELHQLLSLHKDKNWVKQNEIRILIRLVNEYVDSSIITDDLMDRIEYKNVEDDPRYQIYKNNVILINKNLKNQFPIRYFRLPLFGNNNIFNNSKFFKRGFWSKVPKIRISKVTFGPHIQLEDKNIEDFDTEFRTTFSEKLGYQCELNHKKG